MGNLEGGNFDYLTAVNNNQKIEKSVKDEAILFLQKQEQNLGNEEFQKILNQIGDMLENQKFSLNILNLTFSHQKENILLVSEEEKIKMKIDIYVKRLENLQNDFNSGKKSNDEILTLEKELLADLRNEINSLNDKIKKFKEASIKNNYLDKDIIFRLELLLGDLRNIYHRTEIAERGFLDFSRSIDNILEFAKGFGEGAVEIVTGVFDFFIGLTKYLGGMVGINPEFKKEVDQMIGEAKDLVVLAIKEEGFGVIGKLGEFLKDWWEDFIALPDFEKSNKIGNLGADIAAFLIPISKSQKVKSAANGIKKISPEKVTKGGEKLADNGKVSLGLNPKIKQSGLKVEELSKIKKLTSDDKLKILQDIGNDLKALNLQTPEANAFLTKLKLSPQRQIVDFEKFYEEGAKLLSGNGKDYLNIKIIGDSGGLPNLSGKNLNGVTNGGENLGVIGKKVVTGNTGFENIGVTISRLNNTENVILRLLPDSEKLKVLQEMHLKLMEIRKKTPKRKAGKLKREDFALKKLLKDFQRGDDFKKANFEDLYARTSDFLKSKKDNTDYLAKYRSMDTKTTISSASELTQGKSSIPSSPKNIPDSTIASKNGNISENLPGQLNQVSNSKSGAGNLADAVSKVGKKSGDLDLFNSATIKPKGKVSVSELERIGKFTETDRIAIVNNMKFQLSRLKQQGKITEQEFSKYFLNLGIHSNKGVNFKQVYLATNEFLASKGVQIPKVSAELPKIKKLSKTAKTIGALKGFLKRNYGEILVGGVTYNFIKYEYNGYKFYNDEGFLSEKEIQDMLDSENGEVIVSYVEDDSNLEDVIVQENSENIATVENQDSSEENIVLTENKIDLNIKNKDYLRKIISEDLVKNIDYPTNLEIKNILQNEILRKEKGITFNFALQVALNILGFGENLQIDGIFGKITKQNIISFQNKFNEELKIPESDLGNVGPITVGKIVSLLN